MCVPFEANGHEPTPAGIGARARVDEVQAWPAVVMAAEAARRAKRRGGGESSQRERLGE
jgi:hypothetical protein